MSTTARHIRVAVLAHDGTLLGYVSRKPTNVNWRNLGKRPRVVLRKGTAFPSTRECLGSLPEHKAGWRVILYEGEQPPPNLEAP